MRDRHSGSFMPLARPRHPVGMKIEKFGEDAAGKQCSEGYYACAPNTRGVVLIPPGAAMAQGLRLATAEEVLAGPEQPAAVEHLAGGTVDHEAAKPA